MDIVLKSMQESHLGMVRKWRNSPEVSKYMYTSHEISEEEHLVWFKRSEKDSSSKYWIIEYDGRDLGVASLNNIDYALNSCYWAFYLGDTSTRGVGIGSKIEYNIINYVFYELGLNKLRCEVLSLNHRVIRMHEKFGFRREAYYREHVFKGGEFRNVIGLALLKTEWETLQDSLKARIYRK